MTAVGLALVLQRQHEAALQAQAATISGWPASRERTDEALAHARRALWERQMGRIGDATLQAIYELLRFAIPAASEYGVAARPLPELQRESTLEAAYFEQLARQSCPECGDGLCPSDDPRSRPDLRA